MVHSFIDCLFVVHILFLYKCARRHQVLIEKKTEKTCSRIQNKTKKLTFFQMWRNTEQRRRKVDFCYFLRARDFTTMFYFSLSSPSKDDSSCTDESSPACPAAPPIFRPLFKPSRDVGSPPRPRLKYFGERKNSFYYVQNKKY